MRKNGAGKQAYVKFSLKINKEIFKRNEIERMKVGLFREERTNNESLSDIRLKSIDLD